MAGEDPLQDLAEVLREVPAICNLDCLRCACARPIRKRTVAIPTNDGDFRMRLKPRRHGRRLFVRHYLDRLVTFEVDDYRAIAPTFGKGEVINANGCCWGGLQHRVALQPQQGRGAGRQAESRELGRGGLARQHQTILEHTLAYAVTPASCGPDKAGEAFCEDSPQACGIGTTKATNKQPKLDLPVSPWQIHHGALIATMDAVGGLATERTITGRAGGVHGDDHQLSC